MAYAQLPETYCSQANHTKESIQQQPDLIPDHDSQSILSVFPYNNIIADKKIWGFQSLSPSLPTPLVTNHNICQLTNTYMYTILIVSILECKCFLDKRSSDNQDCTVKIPN